MWKKLFSWRDFWPVPICLAMGVLFLLAGKEGSPLMLLLGIASLVYTLYHLAKQLISRISILRSPDYPAMEKDLSDARSFLGGRILLGKDWLFSSYSGKIYPCDAVRDLQQKVSRPPRGSATAKLRAWVPGEGEVVLAAYTYEEESIRKANALAQALERRQNHAQAQGAEAAARAEQTPWVLAARRRFDRRDTRRKERKTMFCIHCGTELMTGAQFCCKCGATVSPRGRKREASCSARTIRRSLSALFAVLVLFLAFFAGNGSSEPLSQGTPDGAYGERAAQTHTDGLLGGIIGAGKSAFRYEGEGFETPEEAALCYVEGLKNLDFQQMLSAFAWETQAEHYSVKDSLMRLASYSPSNSVKFPSSHDFLVDANLEAIRARELQMINRSLEVYLLGDAFTGRVISLPTEADVDA